MTSLRRRGGKVLRKRTSPKTKVQTIFIIVLAECNRSFFFFLSFSAKTLSFKSARTRRIYRALHIIYCNWTHRARFSFLTVPSRSFLFREYFHMSSSYTSATANVFRYKQQRPPKYVAARSILFVRTIHTTNESLHYPTPLLSANIFIFYHIIYTIRPLTGFR